MTTNHQIISPVADVYGVPDTQAKRGKFETQLVQGEIFTVIEEKDGWCKGTCAHDKYPGYVESIHLTKHTTSPTHIVTAARSHTYREPSIKSARTVTLGFGSLIKLTGKEEGFVQVNGGAWIYEKHVASLDTPEKDYIATASKFLETPYYWGGRSGFGIDCSGLVQVSLARAGIAVLRDSDEQEQAIGKPVVIPAEAGISGPSPQDTGFRRYDGYGTQAGDIVFFKGHVGLMADDRNLLHANAFHMKTVIEPLADVVGRGNAVTSVRRV
jgi:cell wall-associated NlpC family hydrolase